MKIAVMGAGAMGSLYGGLLSEKNEVWLVDIWKEHVDTVLRDGLEISRTNAAPLRVFPKATSDPAQVGAADLVLVFVKSVNTASAMRQNSALFGPETMVLTLQNGYGNVEDILPFIREENLCVGTTAAGATMLGAGRVFQAGMGMTSVGVASGNDLSRAEQIVQVLNASGLSAQVAPDVMEAIWTKLLVNVGLNAQLALLNVRNGFIADSATSLALGRALVREGAAVAAAKGYVIDAEQIVQHYYIEGSKVVGHNRCSMLQDVDKKRKTEIEKINGAIVRLGAELDVPTPYNEVLQLLIQAKEQTYQYE